MENKTGERGFWVLGVLQMVFIIWKGYGVINCSWWLVALPVLIPAAIVLILFVAAFVMAIIDCIKET